MVAKGRDCSNLFPAVVKNVVSKNPEVRDKYSYWHVHVHVHADLVMENNWTTNQTYSSSLHSLYVHVCGNKPIESYESGMIA